MNKQEFLIKLEKGLNGLPKADIEERLVFYSEMIDDRIEDGLLEEAAVEEIGPVDSIISQIISDIPLTRLVRDKVKPKRSLSAWEIILLVLGSPIWLAVLLAVFALLVSVYAVMWSVIICLWAVFASLLGIALGGILWGVANIILGNGIISIAVIGLAFISIGLSIFVFYTCKAMTKGLLLLTKEIILSIKNSFIKKEAA
ncbi:MAG: DUF1700 domain-containing protein [Ruminococcaceae bacterium]|nr:DUF1700 domain-containing protein [Oscillospiraceae bacterium]